MNVLLPRHLTIWSLAFIVTCSLAGCGSQAEPTTPPETEQTAETPAEPAPEQPEEPASEELEDVPLPPLPDEPAAEETSKTDPVPEEPLEELSPLEEESEVVVLGSPELTAGIPGEGALTVEQIKAWLDKPENHEALNIELPMGLAAGTIPDGVLEANPITRAKIELGRQLYFDTRLSADSTVSCASCHAPNEGFARHTQFGVGIKGQEGGRNSPISYNRILSKAQFWDGRAPSLEAQAVGPIASLIEMGNTHEQAVKTLQEIEGYRMQFERIFGESSVNIDNVGAAIATFERAIVSGPSPYDYYEKVRSYKEQFTEEDFKEDAELKEEYDAVVADSQAHAISESAIRGRELFFGKRVQCSACHAAANLADEKYHNLGVGMDKPEPDLGRYEVTKDDKDRGAFKTPTIRNVALSAPYMHDGSQKTLLEVVEHYSKGGIANDHLSDKIKKVDLNDQEKKDLVAFMEACTGEFPKIETARLPE